MAIVPGTQLGRYEIRAKIGEGGIYIDAPGDINNIWSLPVAGGTPKQLTKFNSEFIDHLDVARDGKHSIVSRMTGGNDIILIKNFQ
jgi:hypothetical protein